MSPSLWQIAVVVLLFVLLFGRGKISALMSDVAKGIKSFKKGLADDETDVADTEAPKVTDQKSETIVSNKDSEKTNS